MPQFVDMDPPDHMRQRYDIITPLTGNTHRSDRYLVPHIRGMVEPAFSKANIDAMRPHIQKTVDDLLDSLFGDPPADVAALNEYIFQSGFNQPVDLVAKFSLPVPSYV
jgi:fungal nitric oxide reductase